MYWRWPFGPPSLSLWRLNCSAGNRKPKFPVTENFGLRQPSFHLFSWESGSTATAKCLGKRKPLIGQLVSGLIPPRRTRRKVSNNSARQRGQIAQNTLQNGCKFSL